MRPPLGLSRRGPARGGIALSESIALVLRPQRDDDAAFLHGLFTAGHGPILTLSGLSKAGVDQLVDMQFRAQTESYRARFPDARRLILESGGRPVGRLVVEREAADLYIVDIAVCPEVQNRGLGGRAVAEVQREAALAGLGARALVFPYNRPSLAMFGRCGFVAMGQPVGPSLELRWTAA